MNARLVTDPSSLRPRAPSPPVRALALAALCTPLAAAAAQGRDEGGTLRVVDAPDVRVTLGGYLQSDARWSSGRLGDADDGFLLRRARLVFDVSTTSGWQLRLQPDFGRGRALLQDGFVAWRGPVTRDSAGTLEARVGRFRPSFGVERTQSSSTLLFPERAIVNAFMPSRLAGAQLSLARPRVSLAAGLYRAADADVVVDTDGDPAGPAVGGRDLALRAQLRPLGTADGRPAPLELHVGLMAGDARGTPDDPALERFLTPAQRAALVYRTGPDSATTVVADGGRGRLAVGAQGTLGRLHLLAEGVRLHHRVRLVERAERLAHDAWAVRATWLLRGVRTPDLDLRPAAAGRSAIELGARVAGAHFDGDAAPFIVRGSSRALLTGGLAVGWVPRAGTRVAASWDATRRTAGYASASRTTAAEHAFILRVQQGF